jgi:hypothetical protein
MIPGQANKWYPPKNRREAERAELVRQANKLLAADRRSQRARDRITNLADKCSETTVPVSKNGWIKLQDLRTVMRKEKKI